MITPIQVIAAIRIGIKDAGYRFANGGCFQLYLVLKELYPEAVAWDAAGHIYTQIGLRYYDINGSYPSILECAVKLKDNPIHYAKAHDLDFK